MSLLAETLVEEWLNRQGFFTIRGVKQGVHEIDLLAVRHRSSSEPEAWHVESQVSFRPVSYITPLSPELAAQLGKKTTSSFRRTENQMAQCVTSWVAKKFLAARKVSARESLWPSLAWHFVVVHGVVKHPEELQILSSH